eukprot:Colp12_sorted_trinity150504_noHs@1841
MACPLVSSYLTAYLVNLFMFKSYADGNTFSRILIGSVFAPVVFMFGDVLILACYNSLLACEGKEMGPQQFWPAHLLMHGAKAMYLRSFISGLDTLLFTGLVSMGFAIAQVFEHTTVKLRYRVMLRTTKAFQALLRSRKVRDLEKSSYYANHTQTTTFVVKPEAKSKDQSRNEVPQAAENPEILAMNNLVEISTNNKKEAEKNQSGVVGGKKSSKPLAPTASLRQTLVDSDSLLEQNQELVCVTSLHSMICETIAIFFSNFFIAFVKIRALGMPIGEVLQHSSAELGMQIAIKFVADFICFRVLIHWLHLPVLEAWKATKISRLWAAYMFVWMAGIMFSSLRIAQLMATVLD